MKRLAEGIKKRIVEHLACFEQPADVVALIKDEFGITLAARHVRAYDPASFQFAASHRWLEYHSVVRTRYRKEIGEIPIAHKRYRLAQLQRTVETALQILDQGGEDTIRASEQIRKAVEAAAKEVGDWYQR